jgi:hypothetical protein
VAGVNEAPARCSDGEVAVPSGDGNDHGLQDLQDVDAATNDTSELRYPRLKKNLKSSGVRPSEPVPLDDVDAPRQGRLLEAHVPQHFDQERHEDDPGIGVREQLRLRLEAPPHERGDTVVLVENRQPEVYRRTSAGETPPYDCSSAFQGLRRGAEKSDEYPPLRAEPRRGANDLHRDQQILRTPPPEPHRTIYEKNGNGGREGIAALQDIRRRAAALQCSAAL